MQLLTHLFFNSLLILSQFIFQLTTSKKKNIITYIYGYLKILSKKCALRLLQMDTLFGHYGDKNYIIVKYVHLCRYPDN